MVRHDIGRLPVVSRDNPRQVLGYLGRAAVMTARLHRLKEEHDANPVGYKDWREINYRPGR
jgi:CIC family chloride channel protein